PTRPALSMRHSRLPKPGAFCAAWSSTTHPSTPVGSTWSRSRSAYCAASAWTEGSTIRTAFAAKSPPGNDNETPPQPASNGCSQPTKPAPKWAALIPQRSKSHNHCAEVLVPRHRGFDWLILLILGWGSLPEQRGVRCCGRCRVGDGSGWLVRGRGPYGGPRVG